MLSVCVTILAGLSSLLSLAHAGGIAEVSPDEWAVLNATVKGRLHTAYPAALACFESYQGVPIEKDWASCINIQNSWTSAQWQTQNFGTYGWSNYGTCMSKSKSCSLLYGSGNNASPTSEDCQQGGIADYYIAVQEPSDVSAALNFTRRTGVPLVVKNSGHDHKGRSSGPDSLALWMNTVRTDPRLIRSFKPEGCTDSVGDGVVISAGQPQGDLYRFAYSNNITVVGGAVSSVRPGGGWTLGGGHAQISNTYGLGVDNVLQFRTVLADGTYVTANRCQNQELFFALRGGGGNAFGVTMEITIKAHPVKSAQTISFSVIAKDRPSLKEILRIYAQNSPQWAKDGWSGTMGVGMTSPLAVAWTWHSFLLNSTAAQASMAAAVNITRSSLVTPFLSYAFFSTNSNPMRSYAINPGTERFGHGVAMSSRLIPTSALQTPEQIDQVADAMAKICEMILPDGNANQNFITASGQYPIEFLMTTPHNHPDTYTLGPAGTPRPDTAIHPSWRAAVWHMVLKDGWQNDADLGTIIKKYKNVWAATDLMRALAPDAGAYVNESDVYEVNGIETFWGRENYERLMALKGSVDPENLLTCWGCVGWDPADERWGCYPDIGDGILERVRKGYDR